MKKYKTKQLRACLVSVFENTENTILVFFENRSCFLNFVFSVFIMFFRTKKKEEKQTCFPFFICSHFLEHKTVLKNRNQIGPKSPKANCF